jgi:hypothetical protein
VAYDKSTILVPNWGRPSRSQVQLNDARQLIATAPELDWLYLEKWAAELDVNMLLDEVKSDE